MLLLRGGVCYKLGCLKKIKYLFSVLMIKIFYLTLWLKGSTELVTATVSKETFDEF